MTWQEFTARVEALDAAECVTLLMECSFDSVMERYEEEDLERMPVTELRALILADWSDAEIGLLDEGQSLTDWSL